MIHRKMRSWNLKPLFWTYIASSSSETQIRQGTRVSRVGYVSDTDTARIRIHGVSAYPRLNGPETEKWIRILANLPSIRPGPNFRLPRASASHAQPYTRPLPPTRSLPHTDAAAASSRLGDFPQRPCPPAAAPPRHGPRPSVPQRRRSCRVRPRWGRIRPSPAPAELEGEGEEPPCRRDPALPCTGRAWGRERGGGGAALPPAVGVMERRVRKRGTGGEAAVERSWERDWIRNES